MFKKMIMQVAALGLALESVYADPGFVGTDPQGSEKAVESKQKNKSNDVLKQGAPKPEKDGGMDIRLYGKATGIMYHAKNAKDAKLQNNGKKSNLGVAMDETAFGLKMQGDTAKFGGMEWGANVSLTMDKYSDNVVKDSYIYLRNMEKWGNFQIGNFKGVEYRATNQVKDTQTGTGGPLDNSDYQNALFNLASGVNNVQLDARGSVGRALKIMWNSPVLSGFQLGLSYTPNSTVKGFGTMNSNAPTSSSTANIHRDPIHPDHNNMSKSVLATSLTWGRTLSSGAKVSLGATVINGAARTYYSKVNQIKTGTYQYNPGLINRHKIQSYVFAAGFDYKGIEAGVQYIENGKSGEAKEFTGRNAGRGYAGGLGYNFGANKIGVGYHHFVRKNGTTPLRYTPAVKIPGGRPAALRNNQYLGKSHADTVTAQFQHVITDGLATFFEYGNFRSRTSEENFHLAQEQNYATAVRKNQAHTFLVGIGIYF